MRNFILVVTILLLQLAHDHVRAQGQGFDLKHPIQVSGGATLNTGFYTAFGAPSRRDPFAYQISANLNFKLLGQIEMPFSASFSQQEANFAQPFNQYGISPKYKWIATHIGYRNLTFSEFTLAGHTFLGAGVELSPGNWKAAAMYGRLRRPIDEETALAEAATPAYRRVGYGIMLGYQAKGDAIEATLFSAKDDPTSIPTPETTTDITPEQGLAISIKGRKKIAKRLDMEVEYARSAVTRDIRAPETQDQGSISYFGPLYTQRSSSQVRPAYQAKISYKAQKYSLALKYRRVDTDYRTLGAYFFNNDLEDATLNISTNLLKGKLSIAGSTGGQRNDLRQLKATRNARLIGSLNLGYAPSNAWNFSINASNFSSFLRVDRNVLSDSLNFYQVTRNAAFAAIHNFGSDSTKQSISLNLSYQNAVGRKEYAIEPDNANDFYNAAIAHSLKSKPLKLDINSMFSFTYSIMPGQSSTFFGPSIGVNRSLLKKKAKATFRTTFQTVLISQQLNATVWTSRLALTYALSKHHGISAGTDFLRKTAHTATATSLSELRGTFGYSFNF